jgi:ABC-type oligopeptide transport system substrate-binding subunit
MLALVLTLALAVSMLGLAACTTEDDGDGDGDGEAAFPLDDPLVREALSLAINRQAIIDTLFEGVRIPADGMIPPGTTGYMEGAWPASTYDPDLAAEKLDEAGYPEGEGLPEVGIRVNTGSGHEDVIQLIIADLEAIGVDAVMEGSEWAQHLEFLEAGDYDLARIGWGADYPIGENFLYPLFQSESIDNYSGYNNPDVDEALVEARQITDSDERADAFADINEMIGVQTPVIPIMFYTHNRVGSDRISNGVFSALNLFNFEQVELTEGENRFAFYINEPPYIDPWNGQDSEGIQVIGAVFDSLVAFDYLTNDLIPAAAESWDANEDATVWTFTLADATFHNGDPVTAEDFVYAWTRIVDPANESEIAYHLAAVAGYDELQAGETDVLEGVRAVDDKTFEVTLSYPYADFEYVVGHPSLAPVPMAAVEADEEAFHEMPIGNGPFMLTEPWSHDQFIKADAFADYYGETPSIDGIDFLIFADEQTAYQEFQAGNVDFVNIPSGQIGAAIDEYGESTDGYTVMSDGQVLTGAEIGTYYIVINVAQDSSE